MSIQSAHTNLAQGFMNEAALADNLLKVPRIRIIAIGIFRQGDKIFVMEGYDPLKKQTFYRPLGGSIEFGERSQDALKRELMEEADAEVMNVRYLGIVENIFTYNGEMGHEIVLVYEADFTDKSIYEQDYMDCHEDDDTPFKAVWKSLSDFGAEGPLYPDSLPELLLKHKVEAR